MNDIAYLLLAMCCFLLAGLYIGLYLCDRRRKDKR